MKGRSFEEGGSEQRGKLFLREDGSEVLWVDHGVATIPLFRIDVPSSSECIRFCTKFSRAEPDDHVECGKVL